MNVLAVYVFCVLSNESLRMPCFAFLFLRGTPRDCAMVFLLKDEAILVLGSETL